MPPTNPSQMLLTVKEQQEAADSWLKIFGFLLIWGSAVVLALSFVSVSNVHKPPIWEETGYLLKRGYTMSLVLVYLPLGGMFALWYRRALATDAAGTLRPLMKAVIYNSLAVSAAFILFDVIFARLLFTFPHGEAVLGSLWHGFPFYVPGYTWRDDCETVWQIYRVPSCYGLNIPIEEILFYLGGAAVLRAMYLWGSEDFLSAYTVPLDRYRLRARSSERLLTWNWKLTALAVLIVAGGVIFRQVKDGGIPTYLILEVMIGFVPFAFLYTRVSAFINTRAFLMVMILQVLVSTIWEATLAVPYGWWGYEPSAMIGRSVMPWSELPIEACFFWLSVGMSAMFIHESTKIKVYSGRSWSAVLIGREWSWRGLVGLLSGAARDGVM